jgi:hypothetical protein
MLAARTSLWAVVGIAAAALLLCLPVQAVLAYGEGGYYNQGVYYGQGYYQGTYVNVTGIITAIPYSAGAGGYAPTTKTYWGGGGGGGLVLNGSSVNGGDGASSPNNGGKGYGAGGGGSSVDYDGAGGAGAPGVVYIEWDTYTASCTVTITPNVAQYSNTGHATLAWTSESADISTYINNVGYVSGSSGSFSVPLTATTDYSCYANGSGGSDGWHNAVLTITPPPSAPTVTVESSDADRTISLGDSVDITAHFSSAAGDPITHTNIDMPLGTGLGATTDPGDKTITFTPTHAGTYTFYARAQTSYYTSWTTYETIMITVVAPCTLNGTTLQSGESATFYSSQVSPTGQTCSSVSTTRTCTDGVLSGSVSYQYGSCTCAPIYSCAGNDVTFTDDSCQTTTVVSCASPYMCSAGESSCVAPDPQFNEGESTSGDGSGSSGGVAGLSLTGHLQVQPQILPTGLPVHIYWNVSHVQSCAVSGDNGDSWTGLSSGSAGKTSSPIVQKTIFTMHCTTLEGATPASFDEQQTVNVLPIFQEL